ncbi:hypothetical protein D3C87_2161010 [compost metagenome]
MGEGDFGLAADTDNVEGDRGAGPFGPVLEEAEVSVEHLPGDTPARHQFGDLLP